MKYQSKFAGVPYLCTGCEADILDQVASHGVARPGSSIQMEEGAAESAPWRRGAYEE